MPFQKGNKLTAKRKKRLAVKKKGTGKDRKRDAARAEKAEQTEQQAVEEQKLEPRVKAKSTKYVTSDQTGLSSKPI